MGFFDALGKMINGEPVFDASITPARPNESQGSSQHVNDPTRTSTGGKIMPEVRVTRVRTSRNGGKMTSYAWL